MGNIRTYCLPMGSRGVKRVPNASKVKSRRLCLDIRISFPKKLDLVCQLDLIRGIPLKVGEGRGGRSAKVLKREQPRAS